MADEDARTIDPRFDARFQRGYRPSAEDAATERRTEPERPSSPGFAASPAVRRGYLTALWVVGIGFTILGFGLVVVAQFITVTMMRSGYYGGPTPEQIMQSIAYSASGPLITVGLATIVGLLFIGAYRRGPSR